MLLGAVRAARTNVMTTTLCVNQRSRVKVSQVNIMVEDKARDVPAWSNRTASPTQSIARALEKLQYALQKSRIDRATTRPTAEG